MYDDGSEEIVFNLREFCRINNYNRSALYQTAKYDASKPIRSNNLRSYKGIKVKRME